MVNRFMRLIVFFDLPVMTKTQRKAAANFRKFLIQNGFDMLQYSVYSKITRNSDDMQKYIAIVDKNKPKEGSVRALSLTEVQYSRMIVMVGEKTATENYLETKNILEF